MERNWPFQLSDKNEIAKVLEINAYTSKFNLTLSEKDVEILVQERRDTLKQQRRVEFGEGILKKLITTFCDSSYIYQGNYVETIVRLQEMYSVEELIPIVAKLTDKFTSKESSFLIYVMLC